MGYRSTKKPAMLREVKFDEITSKGVTISTKDGKKQNLEADTIVLALTPQLDTGLQKALQGKVPEVYSAGTDGQISNSIMNAIDSGHHVAKAI
jgi:hypothetical protein